MQCNLLLPLLLVPNVSFPGTPPIPFWVTVNKTQHGKRCLWMPQAHVTALTMSELLANTGSKASHHERCSKCLQHRSGNWIFSRVSVLPTARQSRPYHRIPVNSGITGTVMLLRYCFTCHSPATGVRISIHLHAMSPRHYCLWSMITRSPPTGTIPQVHLFQQHGRHPRPLFGCPLSLPIPVVLGDRESLLGCPALPRSPSSLQCPLMPTTLHLAEGSVPWVKQWRCQ